MARLDKKEREWLTHRFFELQAELDRMDLPLYMMHGFILGNKAVLRELCVEWVEVYNKYKEWHRRLGEMIEAIEEALEEKA